MLRYVIKYKFLKIS